MPRKQMESRHQYNTPVATLLQGIGANPRYLDISKNEVGIEIEAEGERLPIEMLQFWATHRDGSLRDNGLEYVLREPLSRKKVPEALEYLFEEFRGNRTKLRQSNRTSVHVHLNCLPLTMKEVLQIVCLYSIFEVPLVRYCGPDREGNLFCLRMSDAEFLVNRLALAAKKDDYVNYLNNQDGLRYSSLNVTSLFKFGTLEFRAMRGDVDQKDILKWLDLLYRVKDYAVKYDSPAEIIYDFSNKGERAFAEQVFEGLTQSLKIKPGDLSDSMRLIQEMCFARKWEKGSAVRPFDMHKKNEDDPDPFGFEPDMEEGPIGNLNARQVNNAAQRIAQRFVVNRGVPLQAAVAWDNNPELPRGRFDAERNEEVAREEFLRQEEARAERLRQAVRDMENNLIPAAPVNPQPHNPFEILARPPRRPR